MRTNIDRHGSSRFVQELDSSAQMLGLAIIGAWLSLFWLLVGIGIGYSLWGGV